MDIARIIAKSNTRDYFVTGGNDEIDIYIKNYEISLYGVPIADEDENEEIITDFMEDEQHDKLPRIGSLTGSLILGRQAYYDGFDFYELCDDMSADLEYVASSLLSDEQISLNFELEPSDIFYIHELEINEEFRNQGIGSRVLEELPDMVMYLFNCRPWVLAYYPSPINYTRPEMTEQEYEIGRMLMDKVAKRLGASINIELPEEDESEDKESSSNVVPIGTEFHFIQEDMNRQLGRRNEGDEYPEENKNVRLIHFYEKNGFREIENSHLLIKITDKPGESDSDDEDDFFDSDDED